ncbi:hypothetical protein CES86_4052 [Brucella lupini]|uniref:Uncharacterized protein n=1 Tax=Brucella lupini TaxID=255457 RepID=A0A256GG73_9HYPH|nr:hypothetical protein CES86_4052 [Brucella lupini]
MWGASAHENHAVAFDVIYQEEIAADTTFAMVGPIPFQGVVKPFRAERLVVRYQEQRSHTLAS